MISIKSKNTKKTAYLLLLLLLIVSIFPDKANANAAETLVRFATDAVSAPFVFLLEQIKNALSTILSNAIIPILNAVMSFNNFFTEGVNLGWTVTRDFANLFFALVLLLIAVATVLNIGPLDNYTAKRILPNFIMVALFINFSKAVVGFLIDISQIIMIELWNAIGTDGIKNAVMKASNLAKASNLSGLDTLALNLVIIILIIIFIAIFIWTVVILIVRIANLWIAIILAPLAFMSFLIPGLRDLYNTWIKLLQSALVTGPVLMFMLYLSVTIMNNGFPEMTDPSANLLENGALFTYILVAILLFASNAIATKAGAEAPPLLQKAAAIGTTVASFGLGKYVGAGGYGTKQFADTSVGGITRGVQVVTGGKYNLNDRYEMMKAQGKKRLEEGKGVENIPFIGSRIKDSRAGKWISSVAQQTAGGEAGRKARFNETQLNIANQAKATDTLHQNPELLRARNAAVAKATEELKGSSVPELIEQFKETTDEIEREAIFAKITELEGLKALLADDEFKPYAETFENESEQIDALIKDKFESGRPNPTRSDRDFRSRIAKIGKDKKQESYVSGIDQFEVDRDPTNNTIIYNRTTPTNKPKDRVKSLSISEMGSELRKNHSAFEIREEQRDQNNNTILGPNGKPLFKLDSKGNPVKRLDMGIIEEAIKKADTRILSDPKTWSTYNSDDKDKIKDYIKNLPNQTPNQNAALQGLGASASSSRVTSNLT